MSSFSLAEVIAVLGLPHRTVQSMVKSGYVQPQKGAKRRLTFSFQDIVVLRTVHGLIREAIPRRKITRAIRVLREQLPREMPLAGLRIRSMGDQVVVQEHSQSWEIDSGQGILAFELVPHENRLRLLEQPELVALRQPLDEWFVAALDLEESNPEKALRQYRKIIAADSRHVEAYVNCGRLLHESSDHAGAEALYRQAIVACEACAALHYNLGVLLEDIGRIEDAIAAYQQSLQCDPDHGDSHYNLARLFELTQRSQHAIRHFNQYRALSRRADS